MKRNFQENLQLVRGNCKYHTFDNYLNSHQNGFFNCPARISMSEEVPGPVDFGSKSFNHKRGSQVEVSFTFIVLWLVNLMDLKPLVFGTPAEAAGQGVGGLLRIIWFVPKLRLVLLNDFLGIQRKNHYFLADAALNCHFTLNSSNITCKISDFR